MVRRRFVGHRKRRRECSRHCRIEVEVGQCIGRKQHLIPVFAHAEAQSILSSRPIANWNLRRRRRDMLGSFPAWCSELTDPDKVITINTGRV